MLCVDVDVEDSLSVLKARCLQKLTSKLVTVSKARRCGTTRKFPSPGRAGTDGRRSSVEVEVLLITISDLIHQQIHLQAEHKTLD
jgi:hypothetical protein